MPEKIKTPKSEKTKIAILEAAKNLFIRKGFAGTSMSEIAASARVTQSLIHHHFGAKESIWKEVKALIAKQAIDDTNFSCYAALGLRDCLEKLLRARINLYKANPELVRLIAWQELEEQSEGKLLAGGTNASPDKWIPIFKELKKQKKIRSSIDEGMAVLMMYGAISVLFKHPSPLTTPPDMEDYLQFVVDSLVKGFS